jgi:hypothetical protein
VEREAALANERAGVANKIAMQSNERAAVIESNNAVASLKIDVLRMKNSGLESRALELEQQIMRTSNDVAKADPLNRPIKSMKADVYLLIRATNQFAAALSKLPSVLSLKSVNAVAILPTNFVYGKDSALVGLRCNEYESRPHFFPSSGTAYSMSFSWPSASAYAMADLETGVFKNNVSVTELREKMGSMEIFIMGVTNHSEITEGSCILTINGSIQERFSIPKFTGEYWVDCPFTRTNSP